MSSQNINITPIEWEFIVDKIKQEQCILVLGPEVNSIGDNQSSQLALLQHLDIPNNKNIYRHYPTDEFFLFDDAYKRTLVCHQIKSFYQKIPPNPIHEMLALIPFHIYLKVTPDQFLQRAFDEQLFSYQSGYYKRNTDPEIIKPPSSKNPLIYNAFGSVASEESIILTHDDLFDFFKSIFTQRSMPEKLRIELHGIKNFIFLGVPFHKWYMQLLLRELEIHNKQYEFTRFAANHAASMDLQTFCLDQFRINFISNDIATFVKALYQYFSPTELRTPQSNPGNDILKVRALISNGELFAAIELTEDITENTPLEDDVLQLASRFRKYNKRLMKGILSYEDQQLQENQLMDTLLKILSEAKNLGL